MSLRRVARTVVTFSAAAARTLSATDREARPKSMPHSSTMVFFGAPPLRTVTQLSIKSSNLQDRAQTQHAWRSPGYLVPRSIALSSRLLRTDPICGCTLVMADWALQMTERLGLKQPSRGWITRTCLRRLCLPAARTAAGHSSPVRRTAHPDLDRLTIAQASAHTTCPSFPRQVLRAQFTLAAPCNTGNSAGARMVVASNGQRTLE